MTVINFLAAWGICFGSGTGRYRLVNNYYEGARNRNTFKSRSLELQIV
jgi:hypothetical protein